MNEQVYKIEYNGTSVVSLNVHDESSVTYSSNKFIVDTLENGKCMLSLLGIDCTLIDVETGKFIPQ